MESKVAPINVHLLSSPEDIRKIERFWKDEQFYHSHDYDFVMQSLKDNRRDQQPYILLATHNDEPKSILVGYVNQLILPWKLGYKNVIRRPVKCLEFPYNSFFGATHFPCIAKAILEKIGAGLSAGTADIAWFWYLRVNEPLYQTAKTTPKWLCRDPFVERVPHRSLKLPKTFEEFYTSRGKNTKSNIRQYRNRLEKKFEGVIDFATYENEKKLDFAMQVVQRLQRKSWQYKNMGQRIFTPETTAAWRASAQNRNLIIHVLYIKDQPVSFFIGYIYNKRYVFEHTGYDPEFKYFHPGMYLLMKIIEQMCAGNKVDIFDFGFSDEQYKRQFSDSSWEESSIALFSSRLGGLKLLAWRFFLTGGTAAAKSALSYLGLLQKIKMLWRHS